MRVFLGTISLSIPCLRLSSHLQSDVRSPTIHGLGRRPNRDPRGTNFKSAYNNIQQRCDTCPGTEVLEPKRPSIRRSDQ